MGHTVAGELVGDQHQGRILQVLDEFAEEPGRPLGVAPRVTRMFSTFPYWSTARTSSDAYR